MIFVFAEKIRVIRKNPQDLNLCNSCNSWIKNSLKSVKIRRILIRSIRLIR
jgi:hypothetical protein